MRTYEMMIIIDGSLEESEVSTTRDEVRSAIADVATIVDETYWGRREFAYEIQKKRFGFYAIFEMTAAPGALDPVERSLRIADNVVRHKLIRLPDAEAARRATQRQVSAEEPTKTETGDTDG